MKYQKVVDKPTTNFIPGYCTNNHKHISAYISALLSGQDPDVEVYVMEFDVDTNKLVEVDYPPNGFNQNKSIKPGYFGPPDPECDAHPTTDALEVIVWNEPVSAKMIGAYKSGLSLDPTKGWTSGYYISGSNFHKDNQTGNWSIRDLNTEIPDEYRARFKLSSLIKIAYKLSRRQV